MRIDEFRNALRILLNDARKSGLDVDELLTAAEMEFHACGAEPYYLAAPVPPQDSGNRTGGCDE